MPERPPRPSVEIERAEAQKRKFEAMLQRFGDLGYPAVPLREATSRELHARTPSDSPQTDQYHAWNAVYRRELPAGSGVLVGATTPFGTYDVVDYLAASSATVGAALQKLCRYFPLINPGVEIVLAAPSANTGAEVTFRHRTPEPAEFFDDYTAGIIVSRFRDAAGESFAVERVAFQRPDPLATAWRERLEKFFGCRVETGAPQTAFTFPRHVWDARMLHDNTALHRTLEEHAQAMLRQLEHESSFVDRVRQAVLEGLADGEPRIEDVAKRLGATPRTVQRRLQAENLSFSQVVDDVRAHLAERYLLDPTFSVGEVAYLLGYSETSAFGRAFKRWRGVSPAAFRSRGAGGSATPTRT